MFGTGEETKLLSVGRKKTGAVRIALVTGVEFASSGEIEGHVVRKLLHAAQVDNARKGARGKLVAHQRHVASAGAARGINTPAGKFDFARRQAVPDKPQPAERIESLQVAVVVWFRSLDRFAATLQVIDTKGDHVVPAGQLLRARRADAACAAPVVQRQHEARTRV